MMKRALSIAFMMCIVLAACKPAEPPPPPTPPPPPEKTPEQQHAEIQTVLDPFKNLVDAQPGAAPYSEEMKAAVIAGLTKARGEKQATENGKQALAMLANDLESIISKARDLKRWKVVLGAIEAYDVLSPNSAKMTRVKERAQLFVNCPKVTVQGFVDDKETKDVYAFLEVEVMPSHEKQTVHVKPGEEFLGLRFQDIIGERKGVRLEYLAIPGHTFDVMTGH